MKLFAIVAFCLVGAISASFSQEASIKNAFESFKAQHDKVYASEDENAMRFRIYVENLKLVEKHNAEVKMGLHSYTKGVNQFSDMTQEEKEAILINLDMSDLPARSDDFAGATAPASLDWRDYGYVTKVQNQGQCGSCWAFSSAGAVEGAHFKATGQLINLSEQQLVDCDHVSTACQGGHAHAAFNHIIQQGGLDTDVSYPYLGYQGYCRFNAYTVGATLSSYKIVARNEETMKNTLAQVGPLSVYLDGHGLFNYASGVLSSGCTSELNHAVLLVGYGTENGLDYWLIKNSWGDYWGEYGYGKIVRNRNFYCGLGLYSSYPIV